MTYVQDRHLMPLITPGANGIDRLTEVPASIRSICSRLMDSDSLSRETCLEIYECALQHIETYRIKQDLLVLAAYRRQVTTTGDIDHDAFFLRLALEIKPALEKRDWVRLAKSMPKKSWVRVACILAARSFA